MSNRITFISRCLLFIVVIGTLPPCTPTTRTTRESANMVRRGQNNNQVEKVEKVEEYGEYAFASVGQTETCRVFSVDIENTDGTISHELQCVPDIETEGEGSLAYVLEGLPPEIENANRSALETSEVYLEVSDVTKTKCHRSTFVEEPFNLRPKKPIGGSERRLSKRKKRRVVCQEKVIVDSDSEVKIIPTPHYQIDPHPNRQLSPSQQQQQKRKRTVLVLRISSKDEPMTKSREKLSDTVFGTSGAITHFASQYELCSNGDLTFVQANGPNIVDGVADIHLDMVVLGEDAGTVMNAATVKAAQSLPNFPDKYDHVLYCLPPGTTKSGRLDWVAFGYFNYYRTVYNDRWCTSLSVKVHEVGHNLGLAHSGENRNKYGDTSGMMGKSFSPEDGPKMCFNAAKSWELGWYSDRRQELDLTTGPKLLNISGIVDYSEGHTEQKFHTVLAKIPELTSRTDLFLMYNDARSFNAETKEFRNRVTIVEGAPKTTSYIRANLTDGLVYRKPNFNGTSQDLVVEMCDFVSGSPSYARVLFFMDDGSGLSCKDPSINAFPSTPTLLPSSSPSQSPSEAPDDSSSGGGGRFNVSPYRQPTQPPNAQPSTKGGSSPSKSPTKRPTLYKTFDPIQFSPTLISVSTTCGVENEFCSGQWRVCCEGFRCNTEYRRCRSTGRFPQIKVDETRGSGAR